MTTKADNKANAKALKTLKADNKANAKALKTLKAKNEANVKTLKAKNEAITLQIVSNETKNFSIILSTETIIEKYRDLLYWGGNGVGDRWANKKFNYSLIYNRKKNRTILYSEHIDDVIPPETLNEFFKNFKGMRGSGIIGIFVHSTRENNNTNRPIRKDIQEEITKKSCVTCGVSNTICDHKNDFYNDPRVLNTKTQILDDFQPLCIHCNLKKRQVCKEEKETGRLYSAKNIEMFKKFQIDFPWERKPFDMNNIECKVGTYWYDPVEFTRKIYETLIKSSTITP